MDSYEEDVEYAVADSDEIPPSQAVIPEVLKDSDTLLVETVCAYPALYNKSLKEYHMSEIRQNCWEMIAVITNTSVAHCQKRWTQLRDSFTNEKRRRENDQKSGSGGTKRKGFVLYSNMEFLQKHIVKKKTFTNIPPPSVATSSTACRQQSNVHLSSQVRPVHRFPGPSTITFPNGTPAPDLVGEINFNTEMDLLSSFPPTPESSSSTPPPIQSVPTLSPEPNTTSTLRSSTYPLVPRVQLFNSEALVVPPKTASLNVQEGSSAFNKVTCTETSTKSGFYNSTVPTLSSPLPPPRTPTPRSTLPSPVSPYSSCSDMSYTFSPDEVSQSSNSRSSAAPTTCYSKDVRKTKKVDPVERSFLNLSSVIQDHFAQKSAAKEPEVNRATDANNEAVFGSLVAMELQKMDEQTKKQKKTRILQILYE